MSYRVLSIILVTLVLTACSRTGLVYDNADWLAYRWAVKLLDADAPQREDWRERFRQLHVTHREQLLPQVIDILHAMEVQAGEGLSSERLTCLLEDAERVYRAHARLTVPLAVDLLQDMSGEQLAHLAAELDERNREYVEKYLDTEPAVRHENRVERYLERIERWTGDLSDEQVAMVDAAVQTMPETAETWLAYRRQQQRRLLDLLQAHADEAELATFLAAWWMDFADRSEALVDRTENMRRASARLALRLDASLTSRQRSQFVKRVAKLRRDLEGVSDFPRHIAARDAIQHCG